MATMLLVVIFVSYIALGIPDSLFGAAWPAMYAEFSLPVSYGGAISLICSVCTFFSSLCATRLLSRFGTWRVTFWSAAATAVGLLCIAYAPSFLSVLLFCVPLGLGAGAIDTGLNGYVALHYSERQMNFLHCFYGVGVMTSPVLVSLVLSDGRGYRDGFLLLSALLFLITLALFLSAPLWRRMVDGRQEAEDVCVLTVKEMAKNAPARKLWVLFFSSCGLEFACGTWGATFLVEARALPASFGAGFVTLFYAGMTLGRFFSGVLCRRFGSLGLLKCGTVLVFVSLCGLAFVPYTWASVAFLFFIGLGSGPLYPNLMNLVPHLFERRETQSFMGSFLAVACLGISVAPVLFGVLCAVLGADFFPAFLCLVFAPFVPVFLRLVRTGKDCT